MLMYAVQVEKHSLFWQRVLPRQSQSGSINITIPGIECFIPLENLIDISKEKSRLDKTCQKLKSEQIMLNNKLNNKNFLEKAPKDVVDKIRKRSSVLVEEINSKLKAIDRLN